MQETLAKIGPNDAGMRISAEEFAMLEFEEPFTYERVKGRLVVIPRAGPEHRAVSRPFRRELGGYWGTYPEFVDDADVEGWLATSPDDDRIPDICVYLAGESSHQTVPNRIPHLVFELVSKSRADQERDYIHKREEYHSVGVKEYVIVDRFKRQVLVLTWKEDDYAERVLKASDEYTSPILPGLKIRLADAFS